LSGSCCLLLSLLLLDDVLLEQTQESLLLGMSLEATVAKLGGGVDELEIDLLQGTTVGAWVQALAEREDTLGNTDSAALEHEEVVLDDSVVGEATHGVDALLCQIVSSAGIVEHLLALSLVESLADAVDLLVDLSTVVVTVLTSSRNCD